jgi:hypothetical protein
MTQLDDQLAELPYPEPPPELSAMILARIARIEQPAPAAPARRAASGWPALAGALGAAVAIALLVTSGVATVNVKLPRLGGSSAAPAMMGAKMMLPLTVSLTVYVLALLAPLRRRAER